jgi:hypothetical protein
MRYGIATVTKSEEDTLLTISVSVAVERPDRPQISFMRCSDPHAPSHCKAGALSGVRYARHAIDRDRFGIDVQGIRGSLDHPASGEGAAIAAMFAFWLAWGYHWTDDEAKQARGWALSEATCT